MKQISLFDAVELADGTRDELVEFRREEAATRRCTGRNLERRFPQLSAAVKALNLSGWSLAEIAELLEISVESVSNAVSCDAGENVSAVIARARTKLSHAFEIGSNELVSRLARMDDKTLVLAVGVIGSQLGVDAHRIEVRHKLDIEAIPAEASLVKDALTSAMKRAMGRVVEGVEEMRDGAERGPAGDCLSLASPGICSVGDDDGTVSGTVSDEGGGGSEDFQGRGGGVGSASGGT